MTTLNLTIVVGGFVLQLAGLVVPGVLVYRQGRILRRIDQLLSPAEAVQFYEKTAEIYADVGRALDKLARDKLKV